MLTSTYAIAAEKKPQIFLLGEKYVALRISVKEYLAKKYDGKYEVKHIRNPKELDDLDLESNHLFLMFDKTYENSILEQLSELHKIFVAASKEKFEKKLDHCARDAQLCLVRQALWIYSCWRLIKHVNHAA